jgi:glucosyl-3-phosphoglycerate synthase
LIVERPKREEWCGDPCHTGDRVTIATFDHRELRLERLLGCKGRHRISVCIPARNEERTVGRIVAAVRSALVDSVALVDELVVVDDGSVDATGERAAAAGARVVRVPPSPATGSPQDGDTAGDAPAAADAGKGGAMAAGVAATSGDLIVFLDGDVEDFGVHFVTGLVGPLLLDPGLVLVKGSYSRPVRGDRSGGGRVTELVARPVISLCFPALADVRQPLAGETALRRSVLDSVALAAGYGVELALLVDVADLYGTTSIAQVDLGTRVHRNRPLAELAPQARDVLRVALTRAGVPTR